MARRKTTEVPLGEDEFIGPDGNTYKKRGSGPAAVIQAEPRQMVDEATAKRLVEIDKDPFLAYADSVGQTSIIGQLLKFTKGEWVAGKEGEEIPLGTRLVVNMDSMLVGWIKWTDNRPEQQVMGKVLDHYRVPRRPELGDLDEAAWELDSRGDPRDPWQEASYLLLKKPGARYSKDTAFTFSGSSLGAKQAGRDLCTMYGEHRIKHDDEFPIVKLDRDFYMHKEFGKTWKPMFVLAGWEKKSLFEQSAEPQAAEESPARTPPRRRKAA
jgi:hypothetical protein